MKSMRTILIILLLAAAVAGCSRYVDSRDPVRSLPEGNLAPVNLAARVNHGSVTLSWEVADSAGIARFRVYVADSTQANYVLRDSTDGYSLTMEELTVDQRYYFKVAAVANSGLEGELSEAVTALVMYLSITIRDDREYTSSRNVLIRINAPPGQTSYFMLSEDSTFADAHFVPFTGSQVSFTLSPGDAVKTVYARLQFDDATQSGALLSDDIILDTRARIDSVFLAPSGITFTAGDTITFGLDAGETDGQAGVSFTGVQTVSLFDDGTNGDGDSSDGIYHGFWVVPASFYLNDASVSGSFTDAAGNRAAPVESRQVLNINDLPQPVDLVAVVLPDGTVRFTWTTSTDQDFASYRLYEDTAQGSPVDTTATLIEVKTDVDETAFDYGRPDSLTYFRVYVFDLHGESAGSNVVTVKP